MDTQHASEAQSLLGRIQQLATEIEQVPNFGPDVWSMQKIDQKCQEIRQLCNRISVLVGTGDSRRVPGRIYPNTGS